MILPLLYRHGFYSVNMLFQYVYYAMIVYLRISLHLNISSYYFRAPELLYGARIYSTGVDIWACGCILAELLLRNPFLPGETDIEQLSTIFSALGTPTEQTWPVGANTITNHIIFLFISRGSTFKIKCLFGTKSLC